MCESAILLSEGRVIAHGEVAPIIRQYSDMSQQLAQMPLRSRSDRSGNGLVRFSALELLDRHGRAASAFHAGQSVSLVFRFGAATKRELKNVVVTVVIENELGVRIAYLSNAISTGPFAFVPQTATGFVLEIDRLPLPPGAYRFHLYCSVNDEPADGIQNAGQLLVESGDFYGTGQLPPVAYQGCLLMEHQFGLLHGAQD
jgi:lipopolysaccharide transport system ATP-binding protein